MAHDLAASVRARLLNIAKAEQTDFNSVLVRYALERFLYRLGQSAHADHFVLKGAMLFNLWYAMPHRPTRDVDLLAGCLMNSGNRPTTPRKNHINQYLADPVVLAGYLMGLCA